MAMTGEGVALIITAIGAIVTGPVMTVWARLDAKTAEAKKETRDAVARAERDAANERARTAARAAQLASLSQIDKKQDSIHVLVNDKSDRQEKKIGELEATLSRRAD